MSPVPGIYGTAGRKGIVLPRRGKDDLSAGKLAIFGGDENQSEKCNFYTGGSLYEENRFGKVRHYRND